MFRVIRSMIWAGLKLHSYDQSSFENLGEEESCLSVEGFGLLPLGAVPVHLVAGIWGTLALGLFATGAFGAPTATGASTTSVVTGLFYGGGMTQLDLQTLGSFSTIIATLGISLLMMFGLKWIGVLRVSKAGELEGLDLHEHGASAYPEYALAGVGNFSNGNSASIGNIESMPIAED